MRTSVENWMWGLGVVAVALGAIVEVKAIIVCGTIVLFSVFCIKLRAKHQRRGDASDDG